MSIEQQLAFLMEGTYFADEGGDNAPQGEGGLRQQMAAELEAKLIRSAALKAQGDPNWPLRVYLGVDPTRESLHIGHMVPVVYLRRFQALGHTVIFLIGDYTAMVGDPSGQSTEREQLTHERVLELARFYTSQAFRLLSPEHTEIRYNGEWLAGLGFKELAELAARFSVNRIIARDDFRKRMEAGKSVSLHETFYALMQGYDAFALNCDVQVGGYDQYLNLLAGRDLQAYFQKKYAGRIHPLYEQHPESGRDVKGPHVMLTNPLLMGTDGQKMSKSWGNTIDVLDEPQDIYGKVMRISDAMIPHYIDVAVEAVPEEKAEWKARATAEPMAAKKWVAARLTELYCGAEDAQAAAEHFQRTVQDKLVDDADITEIAVPDEFTAGGLRLADLIVELKLLGSKSEVRRLVEGGGLRLGGEVVTDFYLHYEHEPGVLLQLGKRKVYRLV